jgi:two-component system sensor histidine kinase RegB
VWTRVTSFVEYPASTNLRRLLSVRSLLLVALVALVALVTLIGGFALPVAPIAAIIGAQALATLLGWLRLFAPIGSVHNAEILFQLGVDIAALTGLLYFTGGWTNPLVSLYLVPIAAAAGMLPARPAWTVASAAVLCYALIAILYRPLVREGASITGVFTMHVVGMWLTFVIAAGLIAYFGTTMAAMLRTRAQALAAAREANLRNEQIIGVATLAAGTAHELSTPLASIAVIASELKTDAGPHQRSDIDLIIAQIDACKDILRRLREAATPADAHEMQHIDTFIDDVRERFQLLRPTIDVAFRVDRGPPIPFIVAEPTLTQAILNLLNNAADASPQSVECTVRWTALQLVLDIHDRGGGFDSGTRAGDRYASASAVSPNGTVEGIGMGMGLLLANATVERLGGSVHIANREDGGAWVQVILPLAKTSPLTS